MPGVKIFRGGHVLRVGARLRASAVNLIGAEADELSTLAGLSQPEREKNIRTVGALRVCLTGTDIGNGRRMDNRVRTAFQKDLPDILRGSIPQGGGGNGIRKGGEKLLPDKAVGTGDENHRMSPL